MNSISHRIGHFTIEHTADTYGHLLPGVGEAAAAKFDDHFHSYEDIPDTNVSKMFAKDPWYRKTRVNNNVVTRAMSMLLDDREDRI